VVRNVEVTIFRLNAAGADIVTHHSCVGLAHADFDANTFTIVTFRFFTAVPTSGHHRFLTEDGFVQVTAQETEADLHAQ